MKNYLLFILLICFSCKKEVVKPVQKPQQVQVFEAPVMATINTAVLPNNLYIPEDEDGWQNGRAGLFNATKNINYTTVNSYLYNVYGGKVSLNQRVKQCTYGCLIANGVAGDSWDTTINNPITRSGVSDFVVNSDGSQSLPLEITVYAGGDVFIGRRKEEFDYTPTDSRLGAPNGFNYSGKDFIWWGWGDMYHNSAIIPEEDGQYVIAVTMYSGQINPKTSLLPIKVTGTTVVTDTTAISANAAKPATNYKATLLKGRVKGVNLSWGGNGYAYCIEKDGVMIMKWQDVRSYYDPFGTRNSVYKIITRAQGRIPDAETPTFKTGK